MIDIKRIQKALLAELLAETRQIMLLRAVDTRSDLVRSTEWFYEKNVFTLLANDYFQYIDTGRKPRAKKVPIEDLIPWMKKNNIRPMGGRTYTSLAYAIQQSIYRLGISGKLFTDAIVDESMEKITYDIINDISLQICDEVVKKLELINQ